MQDNSISENDNTNYKAINIALKNLVYFDNLFRQDLTGKDSGNNRTHISEQVKSDNEKYGTNFPTGKQLINVKKMFISLGATFREKGKDEPGMGSCYEYADRNAPLLWLSNTIGEIRNDMKKNILNKRIQKIKDKDHSVIEPHNAWKKLYIKQLLGLNSSDNADCVSFNENMNLVGLEHFDRLLECIVDKKTIEISYVPFKGEPKCVKVFPYYLKNYNQRWFLLGKTINEHPNEKHPKECFEKISCYALDRIHPLSTDDGKVYIPAIREYNGIKWIENTIDFDEYFYYTIGVTDTENIQETVLRFNPERYNYVKTKKLLPSQQEIQPGEKFYDAERPTIRIRAMQNRELVQQILSFGADVEVIQPETLRTEVRSIIKKMYSCYE